MKPVDGRSSFHKIIAEGMSFIPSQKHVLVSSYLIEALNLRRKYIRMSSQTFSQAVEHFLHNNNFIQPEYDERVKQASVRRVLNAEKVHIKMKRGIITVFEDEDCSKSLFDFIPYEEFVTDLSYLQSIVENGTLKTYCHKRLQFLGCKYSLHVLMNDTKESLESKAVSHRDFYNVRKVDTHIHCSSSMNQKHLLNFIKRKINTCPDMKVVLDSQGRVLTLEEVFRNLNLTAYDLNLDLLDMRADKTFHRFDKFSKKYNPIGQSELREIFLKYNNYNEGKLFAELVKEVISYLEEEKYQFAEFRISIYGKSYDEWDVLARWFLHNKMESENVRWMVQIPRLYDVFRGSESLKNFSEMLNNIFMPLFEVSLNPNSHPELHVVLPMISGFDSVDDEAKTLFDFSCNSHVSPEEYVFENNPPYMYYLFFMYANISNLNSLRKNLNLSTFNFRPHSGESGNPLNLCSSFLMAQNISHGLLLSKIPVIKYLFYLAQIGIAMSPMSNNALVKNYGNHPFRSYFDEGLCVSLSTDDPLMLHLTKDSLMEEYSVASQVWKLSLVDLCEIALNSISYSGFSNEAKIKWGVSYFQDGSIDSKIELTSVPNTRIRYRHSNLMEELKVLIVRK